MPSEWPTNPDDPVDPALRPLVEAGEGESEGFEQADADLIEHAQHEDLHNTTPIIRDSATFPEEEPTDVEYGEADDEEPDEF
jgi:hypothetical protein